MGFRGLGLRTQFMCGATLICILIVGLAAFGLWRRNSLIDEYVRTVDFRKQIQLAQAIENQVLDLRIGALGFLYTGKEVYLDEYKLRDRSLRKAFAELKKAQLNPSRAKLIESAERSVDEWRTRVGDPAVTLRRQIGESKTRADINGFDADGEGPPIVQQFRNSIASFVKDVSDFTDFRIQEINAKAEMLRKVVMWGALATLSLLFGLAFLTARAVTRPVRRAIDLVEAASEGDLSTTLEVKGSNEVVRLNSALNDMVEIFRGHIRAISEAAGALSSSAVQMAGSTEKLSEQARQTGSAVEEASSAVEQLLESAKVSSERARSVAERSRESVRVSDSGKKATSDTVVKMNLIKGKMKSVAESVERLSENTQDIQDIINAVQDLADQSNLLAVNASIEAARAGDQGKGFTIVAQEIKSLADQSRDATEQVGKILKEVRESVNAVVTAAQEGNRAVDTGVDQSAIAGEAIQELAGRVLEASEAADIILTSTEQQFTGADLVASATNNAAEAMKQGSESMRNLRSGSKRLEELGRSLANLIKGYRL